MPYRVEIRSILESLSASREVSGSIVVPTVDLGDQDFRFEEPILFDVTLINAGAGVVATGMASTRVETSCVRCLCPIHTEVRAEVEGFYVRPGAEADMPDEQEVELIAEDSTIDLEPAVTQAIVVELPFAPLHDVDCKGICSECGADLNVSSCDCASGQRPSRFDALKDLHIEP